MASRFYLALSALALLCTSAHAGEAEAILSATGVQGGLIVHVGCGDGTLTAALRANDRFVVHGLDADVAAARKHIQSLGLYGPVSVARWNGAALPYADNLVNLLVAEAPCPAGETVRVLAPRGVAYVKRNGAWSKTVKPVPDGIDEWTHYLHDASGNAVAHDRKVGPPRRLQWVGGPVWSRSHEYDASLSAMVSARGRLFYILDEGPTGIADKRIPDRWMLVARDAFSGVVLWKRPVPDWGWRAWKRAAMEKADWSRMASQRHRLPVSTPRRLVAARDRIYVTLGYHAPLAALDAASGNTLTTYAGTDGADEIVHEKGLLALCVRSLSDGTAMPPNRGRPGGQAAGPGRLMAIEADTGKMLWKTKPGPIAPLSLALSAPHVVFHDGRNAVCLDAASGNRRWMTPTPGVGSSVWSTNTSLLIHKGVALVAGPKQTLALDLADGKVLWTLKGARGFGAANPPDLFVADGLAWFAQGRPESPSVVGYDPRTGEPKRTVAMHGVVTRGHHARCYRSKATDRYLLLPKRATEFIDIQGGPHSRHNWVRGACRYGMLPCNGLLYSTPHPCFCYAGVKMGGFLALSTDPVPDASASPRLTRGPAYGAMPNAKSQMPDANDWTMYRHDPRRSGSTATTVPPKVQPAWTAKLGGKLTQPVVVGGRLFVARVDAGEVRCLDAATGKPVWSRTVGGRIDSAPTWHKGRLIFGSADGHVYALRAADGELAWRFRAAPAERYVVAFGQVESAWPVHGSVLVMNDVAYVTAGRSSFLDGGIFLYGLDPATGKILCETRMDGPHPDPKPIDENAYAMEGAKSDLLVTDGTLIYLFHNAFNAKLEKQPTPVKGKPSVRNLGVRDFGEHLFTNAGFLDDSWFNRNHWMVGNRWTAFNFAHQAPKAGQLVVFDDARTYAVKCFLRRNMLSPQFFPATDGYLLVADANATQAVLVASNGKGGPKFMKWLPQTGTLQTCWNLGVGFARAEPPLWMSNVPVRIRAMVATPGALFAAGPPDLCP
ncbi:PQQ-binding-like beta-propeller repeat protein, partial [bacterium]|nr:PQQ-binding-like beta-propeller repeat protein [bacterium]